MMNFAPSEPEGCKFKNATSQEKHFLFYEKVFYDSII